MEIVRNYNKTDLYCCFKFKCNEYHLKSNEFFFMMCIIHLSAHHV